jgi:hypothetical protein
VERDNTKEWEAAFRQAMVRGLEQVGLAAEGHAEAKCPVDTGRDRRTRGRSVLTQVPDATDFEPPARSRGPFHDVAPCSG